MIRVAVQLSKTAAVAAVRSSRLGSSSRFSLLPPPSSSWLASPLRSLHVGMDRPNASPVTLQMINYALSHARSQKSGPYPLFDFLISYCFLILTTSEVVFVLLLLSKIGMNFLVCNQFNVIIRRIVRTRSSSSGAVPLCSVERRSRCR